MAETSKQICKSLLGVGLLVSAFAAHAGFIATVAAQGPKADIFDPAPPALSPSVMAAISAYNSNVTIVGGNEVEGAVPMAGFTYGLAGIAIASGSLTVVDGAAATTDPSVGRYNTTTGLPPQPNGSANPGHWLESSSNFGYSFSGEGLSAFSFMGTDFGDFGGSVSVEVFNAGLSMFRYDFVLTNDPLANGNLTFFGIKGATMDDRFDSIVFTVQSPGAGDALGIDSLTVGRVTTAGPGPGGVPEPGSLALAGLALLAAAGVVKRRKAH